MQKSVGRISKVKSKKLPERYVFAIVVCLFVFTVGLAACQSADHKQEKSAGAGMGIAKKYQSSPLNIELRLDKVRLTTAERLTLTLVAETDENNTVDFPTLEEAHGFILVSERKGKPVFSGSGRIRIEQSYVLEPIEAGTLTLKELKISTWQKGLDEAKVVELSTEPLEVKVDSLLKSNDPGEHLADIVPPVVQPWNRMLLGGVAVGILAVLGLLVFFWRKHRKQKKEYVPPPLPPHVKAFKALARLEREGFLERGETKRFYAGVSDILRRYIEQQFGLQAPERTTEEFLSELGVADGPVPAGPHVGGRRVISAEHKLLIRNFLTHCDLVKFAEHRPNNLEAGEAVTLCRRFIEESRPSASFDKGTEDYNITTDKMELAAP